MWHGEALANTFRPRGSLQWYFLEEPGEQEGKRSDHRGRKEYRMQRARKYVQINTPDRRRQCRDCRGIGCDRQTCSRRHSRGQSIRQIRGKDCAEQRNPHRRSEEHTSELQSLMRISYAVFCLKKTKRKKIAKINTYKLSTKTQNRSTTSSLNL